ncbi:MAG: hypothetical protein GEU83_01485 [Pseudonocardiaceae bacterium]|nr:hypothetical protein [Pseudonocardiaceae bacterium]
MGTPQPGQQRAYLLGLNTDDFGQAIVAIGNPDEADNVVTYVPGTFSNLGGAASGLEKVDNMVDSAKRADPGAGTAGVVWIGYDAPQSLPEARDVSYAHHAGADLDRFQHGLRATHEGPPSHNTVIAHSYGSTTTGVAARDHGLPADSTVFVGSPGVGVDHARELGLPEGSVFATRADNDIIQHAYDPTRPAPARAPARAHLGAQPRPGPGPRQRPHRSRLRCPGFRVGSGHPDLAGSASSALGVLGQRYEIVAKLRVHHRRPAGPRHAMTRSRLWARAAVAGLVALVLLGGCSWGVGMEPTLNEQQATDRVQQHVDDTVAVIEPAPRLERQSFVGSRPCDPRVTMARWGE